jgi:phosphohistidine phosphatase SixA/8-oxo-dGTP pyrophosphatase MutT (NUDIX family)
MAENVEGLLIRAGGGVLWRPATAGPFGTADPGGERGGERGIEIAIVHRQRYDDWSLPKGKLHEHEHPLLAACREVEEETGIAAVAGRRLPEQEYRLGPDRKLVDYWEMSLPPGDPADFTANDEVDQVRWVRPAEAGTWLSYDRDRDLVRAFLAVPRATAFLLLVRHAKAGDRGAWAGPDGLRPLEPAGHRQAEALRRTLRCFGPERVFASDNVRCVDTVRPLAGDLGVPVEAEPALTEQAYWDDPDRGLRRVQAIIGLGGRSVLSGQGGVIPDLVRTLAGDGGVAVGSAHASKGSVWALSFVDGKLTAADYYPDLARH